MAENEDGSEKSEEPTAKKKSKARDEGQITRSKELLSPDPSSVKFLR